MSITDTIANLAAGASATFTVVVNRPGDGRGRHDQQYGHRQQHLTGDSNSAEQHRHGQHDRDRQRRDADDESDTSDAEGFGRRRAAGNDNVTFTSAGGVAKSPSR